MKMPGEGAFTGYQNIQMLISYVQAAQSEGFQHFQGRLPTVLRLQDLIEEAWDKGINSSGRIETGGIRGTRKYIGTPEVRGPVKFAKYLILIRTGSRVVHQPTYTVRAFHILSSEGFVDSGFV
jgi:hypothetical protein